MKNMVRTKGDEASEQRVIDDVKRYGWHVVGVEDDDEGPGFAYSIGIQQTLDHPEIIVFGLKNAKTMMQVINVIGDEVRKGERFEDWHESDEVLDGYSCMFRTVPKDAYREYLGYAMWFYRPKTFDVLQCIWPDKQHRYPWHPDCPQEIRQRQPILAHKRDWPFHEGKNRAVFTTNRVLDGSHPILVVYHGSDGDWQFLCGTTNRPSDGKIVSLGAIVDRHASLAKLADLPEGWRAVRDSARGRWRRERTR
jgi:hypothetical protein